MTDVATQVLTRARLAAAFRIAVAYGGLLAGAYAHARSAKQQGCVLDKLVDAQAEIDRRGAIYSKIRRFVTFTARRTDWQLGQVRTFTYPRYGFALGVPMMIVGATPDVINQTTRLTLWG